MNYRGRCAIPVLGLLGSLAMSGAALAGTTSSNTAGSSSMAPEISAQMKADNPQAVMFKDNGKVTRNTENAQVTSGGAIKMRSTEYSWMAESGVVLNKGRRDGLYKPGEISYVKDAAPYVVLTILMPGASVYQTPEKAINNPTLVLPAGRPVTFNVMNFSQGYPGTFTVVRKAPPYPTWIVPKDQGLVFNSGWIARTPISGAYSPYRTVTYTFDKPGKYYYLSMQPGNAAGGQWGEIVVKSTNGGA
jgi:rusticyanin